ncbi:MFS transporter [Shimia ponticola]|uniref:MFS transporter n=1 Tax=Shimia ponticola TaxID=2582893 RepID=UPI00164ACF14|nr:MFS transporter [Shimia ponticola]
MKEADRTQWGLVAILFICGLFAALQFIKVSLVLDDLVAFYDRRIEVIAILVSLVSFVGILLGVVAGAVVARLGGRRVILGALGLGALLSLSEALLPPFWLLFVLRLLEGVSHLALVVAIPPIMAAIATPRDQPMVMSIWAMFFGVAFAVGSVVIPPIMTTGGLSLLFAMHGTGLAILATILWPLLPNRAPEPREITFVRAHVEIYSQPNIRAPGLIFVFYTVLFVAVVTFLPPALDCPALAGILPLVSLLGNLTAGALGRRWTPDYVMVLGYLCLIGGTVGLAIGLIWPAYVLFIGMGLVPGACFAAIPRWNASDGDRALATGAIAQLGNVGTGLGTPIFAVAVSLGALNGLLTLLGAISIAGLLVVLTLRRGIKTPA